MTPTTLHTFDEWLSLGMCVMKGQRHIARNRQGVCLFARMQVRPLPVRISAAIAQALPLPTLPTPAPEPRELGLTPRELGERIMAMTRASYRPSPPTIWSQPC